MNQVMSYKIMSKFMEMYLKVISKLDLLKFVLSNIN